MKKTFSFRDPRRQAPAPEKAVAKLPARHSARSEAKSRNPPKPRNPASHGFRDFARNDNGEINHSLAAPAEARGDDYVFGLHAVTALLKHHPHSVVELLLQQGRHDPRMAAIVERAQALKLPYAEVPRAELDEIVNGV
ncbi:MAG: hypothetical protein LBE21_03750, partial [Pseudomonadales bacterium]|nr:hypothetical protein [Pseudomonadales bacterium]